MTLHLDSNEFDTGTKYEGTWTFSKTITGTYRMIYQDFSTELIPWCFSGCNELQIEDPNNIVVPPDITYITFPQITDTDSTSVRAWFTAAFNTAGWVTVTSSSYDSNLNQYTFNFSASILVRYATSSVGYVFNWVTASPLSGNPINSLVIDAKWFTSNPKYLHAHSTTIISEVNSTDQDNPAFLVSTADNFVANQDIYIKSNTRVLQMGLYRTNIPIVTVPIINDFDMIFEPI